MTRYLFVVDTSASMSRYAGSTYRALEQFIDTGLQGQMRAGEAFDVWCFNDQVFANRLTPFVWDPPLHQALANTAIKGVKAQRFERTARFDRLLVALNQTARTADPLTIVLFTDGTERQRHLPEIPQRIAPVAKALRDDRSHAAGPVRSLHRKFRRPADRL